MIEHELDPVSLVLPRDPPERVRRIACLDDVEAILEPDPAHEPVCPKQTVGELPDVAELCRPLGVRRVTIDVDAVDDSIRLALVWRTWRDHADLESCARQRRRLHPHPPIERHREVLDENDDMPLVIAHQYTPS